MNLTVMIGPIRRVAKDRSAHGRSSLSLNSGMQSVLLQKCAAPQSWSSRFSVSAAR